MRTIAEAGRGDRIFTRETSAEAGGAALSARGLAAQSRRTRGNQPDGNRRQLAAGDDLSRRRRRRRSSIGR